VIRHEVTLFDPALLLQRQLAIHPPGTASVLRTLLRYLGTTWYLHSHLVGLRLS
jgi:hypothetical protein